MTEKTIEGWIDKEKLVDVTIGEHKIALRPGDIEMCKPFGLAAWQTSSALREMSSTGERDRLGKAINSEDAEAGRVRGVGPGRNPVPVVAKWASKMPGAQSEAPQPEHGSATDRRLQLTERVNRISQIPKRYMCPRPWSLHARSSWYGRTGRGADRGARRCARRSSRAGPGAGWRGAARCDRSRRS